MSSTISSLSGSSWVSSLFSKLDTKNQGYIDKSELQTALEQISSSDSSTSAEKLFNTLDADKDGKVTQQELSDSVKKLAAELDNQYNQSRVQGQKDQEDTGYSKDELTSMISEIGSSDSKRTTLMQSIVDNFDKADTDGNGKVSNSEAMAYDQATNGTSSASATGSVQAAGGMPPPPPPSGGTSTSDSSTKTYDAADTNQDGTVSLDELIAYQSANSTDGTSSTENISVIKTLMQLMEAYGISSNASSQASTSSSISAIA